MTLNVILYVTMLYAEGFKKIDPSKTKISLCNGSFIFFLLLTHSRLVNLIKDAAWLVEQHTVLITLTLIYNWIIPQAIHTKNAVLCILVSPLGPPVRRNWMLHIC